MDCGNRTRVEGRNPEDDPARCQECNRRLREERVAYLQTLSRSELSAYVEGMLTVAGRSDDDNLYELVAFIAERCRSEGQQVG